MERLELMPKFVLPIMSAFTLLLCSFVTHGQNQTSTKDEKIVVVGSIEALDIDQAPLAFNDFADIINYIEAQQHEKPKRVLDTALQFLRKRTSLSSKQKIVLLTHIAQLQKSLAMPQQAILSLAEIHKLEPNLDEVQKQQNASQLAELYQQTGNYYHAIEQNQAAFTFAIANQNVRDAVIIAQQLAGYFLSLNLLEQAQLWVAKAEQLALNQGNNITKIVFYLEQSRWHVANREYFLAEIAAKKAINIASTLSLTSIEREASLLLVDVLLIERKFSTAEPLLQMLFDQAQTARDRAAQFEVLISIIELQLTQNKINEAQHFSTIAKQLQRFAYAMPNADSLNNRFLGQQVQILMAQEKWRQALNEIVQMPYKKNAQWYTRYMIILFNVVDDAEIGAELTDYVQLLIEQETKPTLAIKDYKLKLLAMTKDNLQQQLILTQTRSEESTHKFQTLLEAKSNLINALFVMLVLCLLIIYVKYFKPKQPQMQDSLTGLPTINELPNITDSLFLLNTPFSFLLFDLDNFAQINDSQGVTGGDLVIRNLVAAISELLPRGCTLGRLQGDTFYVVAIDFDRQQAKILADRIRLQLHKCDASIQSNILGLSACIVVAERREFSDNNQMITVTSTCLKQIQETAVDKTVVFESNC